MKKLALALCIALLVAITSAAYAGMGFTWDEAVSMLEKTYTDSDSTTYTFAYDKDMDAYYAIIAIDDISETTDAYRNGSIDKANWEKFCSSTVDMSVLMHDYVASMVDDTEFHMMLIVADNEENGSKIVLAVSDGKIIKDVVNPVDSTK